MKTQQATAEQLPARGVYLANFLVDGVEVLIAVDPSGSIRKLIRLVPGVDEVRAAARLERWLDENYPVLKLVTDAPGEKEPVDPYGYEDHLAWLLRIRRREQRRYR